MMQSLQPTKQKSRHRAAFLLCPEKCLPLQPVAAIARILVFYFDLAPTKNRGIFLPFWCSFVANGQKKNRQPAINQRFERLNHV